jgi:hypothetical protein
MNLSWGQIAIAHNPPSPPFIREPSTLIDECVRFRLDRLLEQLPCAVREHLSQRFTDSVGYSAISDSG